MNADDRVRDAYRDLADRAHRATRSAEAGSHLAVPPPAAPQGLRWLPAGAALAAVVLVAAGTLGFILTRADDQLLETATSTSDPATADDSTQSDDDVGTGDADPEDGSESAATDDDPDPADGIGGEATGERQRLRVATELIEADSADPFLNVRLTPGADGELLAKLPATYTGIEATGAVETTADGGTWIEVVLRDPVPVTTVEGDQRRPPPGWVNRAFVETMSDGLAVGTDEVPACGSGLDRIDPGPDRLDDGYLYALESGIVADGCLRVILTFGSGSAPFVWDELPSSTGPAAELPQVITTMSGGFGVSIDLGVTDGAWPGATQTNDGAYAVRLDDGSLDLVTPLPVDGVTTTALTERGIVVVDLSLGDGERPPAGAGVALTRPVLAGSGTVDIVGVARPFEANLGVTVEDSAGRAVDAVFSGGDHLGTLRGTEYGVGTTDWTEAWGAFALRIEGLAAGDYVVVLNADGGADDPDTLRLPITLDSGGEPPSIPSDAELAAAQALLDLARGGDVDRVPLADEVHLGLGAQSPFTTASRPELADRATWTAPDELFNGFTGPFNALDRLGTTGLRFTSGQAPHCAGPPLTWPGEYGAYRQVNIEPVGIDSCIQWFAVHLFLDDDDRIAAVVLDLWAP